MTTKLPTIPITKYIAWLDTVNGITVSTRDAAIRYQRLVGEEKKRRYPDDNAALYDYMAERGAWTCDRADGKMGGSDDD